MHKKESGNINWRLETGNSGSEVDSSSQTPLDSLQYLKWIRFEPLELVSNRDE